jgi:hypothetical protein
MTEQEIDNTLEQIQKRLSGKAFARVLGDIVGLVIALLSLALFASAFISVFLSAAMGKSVEEWFGFVLLFSIPCSFIFFTPMLLKANRQRGQQPEAKRIWEFFIAAYTTNNGLLSNPAKAISSRIALLLQFQDGSELLRVHQAARLVDLYQKEQLRLEAVTSRINELNGLYSVIDRSHKELIQHGETNARAELSLKEVSKARAHLSRISEQLKRSAHDLEMILTTAESEWRVRELHKQLDVMADKALERAILPEPVEVLSSSLSKDLEERISTEIALYLRLEKEARQYLDNVRTTNK